MTTGPRRPGRVSAPAPPAPPEAPPPPETPKMPDDPALAELAARLVDDAIERVCRRRR